MTSNKLLVAALLLAVAASPVLAKKDKKKAEEPAAGQPAAQQSAPAAPGVVAYVGDEAISEAELDKQIADSLAGLKAQEKAFKMQLRQREFDLRSQGLEQMIVEKLEKKEAAARGIQMADLLKAEIDDKAGQPTKEELDKFFEQNKARMGGKTREQAGPDIERYLRQQKLAARRADFTKELMDKAKVRVLLEPLRVQVPIAAGTPSRGPENAPVTFVEFSDFQCPYCKRAEPIVQGLLAEYKDNVRFVYCDYPLAMHQRAKPASLAARCAEDQKKYWEFHQNLMNVAGDLSDDDLKKRAGAVGLDAAAFSACYDGKKHEAEVQSSFERGTELGVTGTPTFFVNGRMLVGARPVDEFRDVIDDELVRKGVTPPTHSEPPPPPVAAPTPQPAAVPVPAAPPAPAPVPTPGPAKKSAK